MYTKVPNDLNFVSREKEVNQFWKEHDTFRKSLKLREGAPTYTFYDGPPTANGKPHIGHVLTRVIKDMIPRYRTMKGYFVPRKAGWDTHGLPVELEVEKQLGLEGKEQIEEYGLDPFIQKCKESVWKYKGMWEDFSDTVGFWADMDDPYVTYHDDFIESEWWALKEIWKKDLLYKGFKIVPYCPRCETPLSSHEVAQGYKAVKERSAIVRFKIVGEDAYFLAWTTTPWTLPSNVGLCVNPDETYARVKAADGYTYIMAKALLDSVLSSLTEGDEKAYEILEEFDGKSLEYKEYEPLWQCTADAVKKQKKKAHFMCVDSYVTMTDGTGIVHQAPAFGEDDARVGRNYDMPFVQFVDAKGNMTPETPYAGMFVKNADPEILKDLDKEGKLFSAPKFEHDYPFCWRCDTPLLYYARETWFIKMTALRDNLVRNNKTVNWIPASIGEGRFGNWLENIQDWGLSRNRYWGTPLNIWVCPECAKQVSVGSREELAELTGDESAKTVELHRPYIDKYKIKCPDCGAEMSRTPEVIDCWFDSGAMPFAQHHYPFENKDLFEQQYPAAFISEAVDQTRGWFYSLMAESTLLFDNSSFENVIVLGHVQDENGQKMSKSKGNAVDPFDALEKFGADAIRWYFYTNSAPWLPNRFHDKAVVEGQRKFLGTLWNTYAFWVLYAEIDQFDWTKYELKKDALGLMDRWLLSKMHSMIKAVDEHLMNYRIPEAANVLNEFVDEMSNWYVRRGRERFWAKGMEQDKINAYLTLHTALVNLVKCAAPMIPFMAEQVYQNLVCGIDKSAPESVHLTDFPVADESMIDKALEADMEEAMKLTTMGRAARNASGLKNRQPLQDMFVAVQDAKAGESLSQPILEIIRDELNVKNIRFVEDGASFVSHSFKPQMRTVGPKFGKQLNAIRETLQGFTADLANTAWSLLQEKGKIGLDLNAKTVCDPDSAEVVLLEEDLLTETVQTEGFATEADGGYTVALDTRLTEELLDEGVTNELISKLQNMRKDFGLEVMDRITVKIAGSDKICAVAEKFKEAIATKVLADQFAVREEGSGGSTKEWDFDGEKVTISINKN